MAYKLINSDSAKQVLARIDETAPRNQGAAVAVILNSAKGWRAYRAEDIAIDNHDWSAPGGVSVSRWINDGDGAAKIAEALAL
jgi:hypothetical protein